MEENYTRPSKRKKVMQMIEHPLYEEIEKY